MPRRLLLTGLFGLFSWLFSWGLAYTPLELSAAADAETPRKVRVQGRYTADRDPVALVRGTLSNGDASLRVEGTVFDWRPQSGTPVDLWGVLEPRPGGPVLVVHNGRDPGDSRRPRPAPKLAEGERVSVWLQVTTGGTAARPVPQGVSEDRVAFLLPDYAGPPGVACVTGEVAFLSVLGTERPALTGSRLCGE